MILSKAAAQALFDWNSRQGRPEVSAGAPCRISDISVKKIMQHAQPGETVEDVIFRMTRADLN